ncbi:hypothetical protein HPP92_011866 [Vanilla planifolia]|uniref:Uncharacterized protein n=1 Tax=Vanilla planifolia TaxID=51239 RepID=A0A835R6W6_VANPL|nr:hypothetical protein HPP92_011866 [Vanilla planifolia]
MGRLESDFQSGYAFVRGLHFQDPDQAHFNSRRQYPDSEAEVTTRRNCLWVQWEGRSRESHRRITAAEGSSRLWRWVAVGNFRWRTAEEVKEGGGWHGLSQEAHNVHEIPSLTTVCTAFAGGRKERERIERRKKVDEVEKCGFSIRLRERRWASKHTLGG